MNTIILDIKGKNINNFILKIHNKKINIYNIDYLKYDEVKIEVLEKDYEIIYKMKTIYDVKIIDYKGLKRIKNKINYNKYLLISLLIGIVIFTLLINVVFDIEVLCSSPTMRNYILDELDNYGIKKYSFIKSFNDISNIKKQILDNNKDKIEWIDIERVGTKYIVKLELRKTNFFVEDNKIYNIVSKNDAVIKSIEAYSGEIVSCINCYVKKGDTIISSNITLNDEVKNIVSAKGKVYGEVWYQIEVIYPLNYYEEKETGLNKEYYNIRLINKDYNLSKIKNKKTEDKIILKSDLLPIYFSKQKQKEIEIINNNLTEEQGVIKGMEEGRRKINNLLNENEFIINEKCLKINSKDSKIVLDMFYTVYKDITLYKEIEG